MQNPLRYTAANLDETLYIAAKIYDVTSGTAVLDSTVTLDHVINGTYFVNFESDDLKDYLINIIPYTDGTYTTTNPLFTPSDEVIKARDVLFKKNTARAFTFPLYDTDGALVTGQTVTATRAIDGAAFSACANSVTELSNGLYKITLAAADMNGTEIVLKFAASGARTQIASIYTNL